MPETHTVTVIADSPLRIPSLGAGFSHILELDQFPHESAITCTPDDFEQESAVNINVFEFDEQVTVEQELKIDAEAKTSIAGSLGFSSYTRVFERHTLFVFGLSLIRRSALVTRPRLSPGMLELARSDRVAFKRRFGTHIVMGVDYGGLLSVTYAFETKDIETRRNISASISKAGVGSASLSASLSEHHVTTRWTADIRSVGGSGFVPATPELGRSLSGLQSWIASIQGRRPVRLHVSEYQDVFPGFPSLRGGIIVHRVPAVRFLLPDNELINHSSSAPGAFAHDLDVPSSEGESTDASTDSSTAAPHRLIAVGDDQNLWPADSLLTLQRGERKQVYAPPAPLWCAWTVVEAATGSRSFTISVTPIGDTVVTGEVRYFAAPDQLRIESFFQETTIHCENVYSTVEVRLQGTPFGSSCWVDVE